MIEVDTLFPGFEPFPQEVGDDYSPLATRWDTSTLFGEFQRRSMHQVVSYFLNSRVVILLMGGWSPDKFGRCNDLWQSVDSGKTFVCVREFCEWSPRCQFKALSSNDGSKLIVLGGDDGDYRSDVWLSVNRGKSFLLINSSAPWRGRSDFGAVLLSDSSTVILCGGKTVGSPITLYHDVWISPDCGSTWSLVVRSAPWCSRSGLCLVATSEDAVILVGGNRSTLSTNSTASVVASLSDVWRSKDRGKSWKLIRTHAPWNGRYGFSLTLDPTYLSSEIVLLGGTNDSGYALSDAWGSIDAGATWIPKPINIPSQYTINSQAVSCHGSLWLIGGESSIGQTSSEVFSTKIDTSLIKRDYILLMLIAKHNSCIHKSGANTTTSAYSILIELWTLYIIPFAIDTRLLSILRQ